MCKPSAGARYCWRKLLAVAEGHAACSDKCGLSGSSEADMLTLHKNRWYRKDERREGQGMSSMKILILEFTKSKSRLDATWRNQ